MNNSSNSTQRKYYLDWLRVIAFYILIFYHVGMIFVPWDFHIKNNVTSEWFETWMAFFNQWRLPLLFMISGIVIYYSLGKRTGKEFFIERSKRLLIPLIFGMFVIVPPQIYVERISSGIHFANYWEFWKTVFVFIPYPKGGSLSWHHLWYILYIFVYSIIALPIFLHLKSSKSILLREKVSDFFTNHPNAIYLLIIPLLLLYYSLAGVFPTTHGFFDDWYNHSISFTLFIFGFFISSFSGLWEAIIKNRKKSLIFASIPTLFLLLFVWGPTFEIMNEDTRFFEIFYGLLKWILIPCWLFTILGYSKFFLNKPSAMLTYANESVYPLYILHQTIMIILGYYIVQLNLNVLTKFVTLILLTFGGSFLFYELFIKRFNLMRMLFGLKPKQKMQFTNTKIDKDMIL
ncbi:MAG: acyltransferase family protein [Melioribacteraceae bacterium]